MMNIESKIKYSPSQATLSFKVDSAGNLPIFFNKKKRSFNDLRNIGGKKTKKISIFLQKYYQKLKIG